MYVFLCFACGTLDYNKQTKKTEKFTKGKVNFLSALQYRERYVHNNIYVRMLHKYIYHTCDHKIFYDSNSY